MVEARWTDQPMVIIDNVRLFCWCCWTLTRPTGSVSLERLTQTFFAPPPHSASFPSVSAPLSVLGHRLKVQSRVPLLREIRGKSDVIDTLIDHYKRTPSETTDVSPLPCSCVVTYIKWIQWLSPPRYRRRKALPMDKILLPKNQSCLVRSHQRLR